MLRFVTIAPLQVLDESPVRLDMSGETLSAAKEA